MQITKLKEEGTDYHLKVVIANDAVDQQLQNKLSDLQKTAKLPGFRPGKVPIAIISKKYADSVRAEVVQDQINESVNSVIKEHKLNIATSPKIEDLKSKPEQDIEFILKFEVIPEIKMPEFHTISVEKPVLKVSDKEIKAELESLAKMSTTYDEEKTGKAAKGDRVTIDAVGSVDGIEFEGGNLKAHKLVLGSKSFIDNFEDQLIGTKVGDEIIVKVTFPKEYHAKDLADKPAEFKVKVLAVHEGIAPKIDEEFAKKLKCETVAELEGNIRKYISSFYNNDIHTMMKMHLFDQLESVLKFDAPTSLVDKEFMTLKSQTAQIAKEGDDFKNKSEQEVEEYCKKLAIRRVRIGLMLSEYAQNKELKITEEDIKAAIFAEAKQFPGHEGKIIEFYSKNQGAVEQLKGLIIEEKSVKHIFDNEVKIVEKEYNKKDLEALIENQANERI
jgi:trigger factor